MQTPRYLRFLEVTGVFSDEMGEKTGSKKTDFQKRIITWKKAGLGGFQFDRGSRGKPRARSSGPPTDA
jgi:hypothetical protein